MAPGGIVSQIFDLASTLWLLQHTFFFTVQVITVYDIQ